MLAKKRNSNKSVNFLLNDVTYILLLTFYMYLEACLFLRKCILTSELRIGRTKM